MSKKIRIPPRKQYLSLRALADLLFPIRCVACFRIGSWLCSDCTPRLKPLLLQTCYSCQRESTRFGESCVRCQKENGKSAPLDAVFAGYCFQIPAAKELVHIYKYRFLRSLAAPLGSLLEASLAQSALPLPDALIPVPLHKKRLRFRGFNQSLLIAQYIQSDIYAELDIPLNEALVRTRATKPQQRTDSRQERLRNLQGAFALASEIDLRNKTLWLIDDVATTNATLTECAKVLKVAGAAKVYGVVLAK